MNGRPLEPGLSTFTLAHLSDPHLGPLPAPGIGALLGKRITGFLSWRLKRSKIHRPAILALLGESLKRQKPDHIVVTGDLVNISLPAEFVQAKTWLSELGAPATTTIIPGNHDAYVALPWASSIGLWADFMSGRHADLAAPDRPVQGFADFPFARILDDIALVGTSTALPTLPFAATGRLGSEQLARLEKCLRELGAAGKCRVVLIHHPPFGGGAYRRKTLTDSAAFQDVIAKVGCELVLHGHTHVSGLSRLPTPFGHAPVIGVSSASALPSGHKDPARYHIYRFERQAEGWRLTVDVHELAPDCRSFVAMGSMAIPLGSVLSSGRSEASAGAEIMHADR